MSKKITWKKNYQDKDLTFCLQIYNDLDLTQLCLYRLRQVYPESNIICVFDGGDQTHFEKLNDFNVQIVLGDRLYAYKHNTSILKRMFELFALYDSTYFFRIDTDTHFHRRIKSLPNQPCNFGKRKRCEGKRFIQGGCIGFHREIVKKILKTKILDKMNQNDDRDWLKVGGIAEKVMKIDCIQRDMISTDWMIRYVIKQLNFKIVSHPDIYCLWPKKISEEQYIELQNRNLQYAVTHPCLEKIDS